MADLPAVLDVPDDERSALAATVGWLRRRRPVLCRLLQTAGAVLLRGLAVREAADVAAVRDAVVEVPVGSREPFAPRTELGHGVYGDYHWPVDRELCPQHEQSYRLVVPQVVLLACLRPADAGGETLLADARQVLARLPAGVASRLRTNGWLMVRTFRDRIGISWRDAFEAGDDADLPATLDRELISHRWLADGTLRTVRRRPAVVHHPDTAEPCWFNHAAFFNEWGLDPLERQVLREAFGRDGLPLNSLAGDGSALTANEVTAIQAVYAQLSAEVLLHAGDVLVLDNVLVAHGRRAYQGPREVVVAMGEPLAVADCRPAVPPSMAPIDLSLLGFTPQ